MRTIRSSWRAIGVAVAAMAVLGSGVGSTVGWAGERRVRIPVDADLLKEQSSVRLEVTRPASKNHLVLAQPLLEVIESERAGTDWREPARRGNLMVEGGRVLVEIRLIPERGDAIADSIRAADGLIRHHHVPSLMEVWLPPNRIRDVADQPDVRWLRPARLIRPVVGNTTSEGVEVLNIDTPAVDYDYRDLGADGAGVLIANIDAGYAGYASLQASGDWPQPANLRRFEVDGGPVVDCDVGTCGMYSASSSLHGSATMEITFDIAPGADYMTYATYTVFDWYDALIDAASLGADVVTQSLGAVLDGVGDGSECPPHWGDPCGTIAEAAGIARSQGSLVINAASNSGTEHWGGTFADSGDGTLDWGSGGNLNIGQYCFYDDEYVVVDLFWDDWTNIDHDYDLYLYERVGDVWEERARSWYVQNGNTLAQTPQETLGYVVSEAIGGLGCQAGSAAFAILIDEYDAATDRHLQVFADNWGSLTHIMEDRSLGFPADSPNVYTVGAVDVVSPGSVESFSSEGPVLGPGGSAAPPSPPNPKPDGVGPDGVSTESYGVLDFFGTSASAPHVAGVAALLIQLRNEKVVSPPTTKNPEGIHSLLSTFALEDPTFTANHTTERGNGLVALRFCDESVSVSSGEWIMLGLPCVRRDSSTVAEVLGDDLDLVGGTWEVWEQGQTLGSYVQLFEGDLMKPGVGYWLVYDGDATVDIQGLVQDRSEAYPFQLHGEDTEFGWANFLGHPFTTDVDWPDVRVYYAGAEHSLADAIADGVMRNFLWKPYTATGYVENDGTLGEGTLNTFDGFWVKAFQDVELRIPTTLAAKHAENSGSGATAGGWSVHLQATAQGVSANARIGHLPNSRREWDLHDAEHMPSFEAHQLAVVMPHPDWKERAGDYVRDYRSPRPSSAWKFEVRSNQGGLVELQWKGPRSILERSMVIDRQTGTIIDALKLVGSGYRFKMAPGVREFLWRVR